MIGRGSENNRLLDPVFFFRSVGLTKMAAMKNNLASNFGACKLKVARASLSSRSVVLRDLLCTNSQIANQGRAMIMDAFTLSAYPRGYDDGKKF